MLWRSLQGCKDFIETFISLPNEELFHLTAFVYSRLCYVFITLARLVFLNTNQSTASTPGSHWNIATVAKEAQYQHLGKQVLAKFTSIATDYIGPDGHRDPMSALASAMKLLLTGYVQQMNDFQKSGRFSEPSDQANGGLEQQQQQQQEYGGNVQIDNTTAAQASTADLDMNFDLDVTWDATASAAWDDVLETFTMSPFS